MTNEEKAKKLEDIAKLEEQLSTLELPALLRLQKYNILKLLKFDFIKDQNSKEQCKELDDMANKIIDESYRLIRGASIAEQGELYKLINNQYETYIYDDSKEVDQMIKFLLGLFIGFIIMAMVKVGDRDE